MTDTTELNDAETLNIKIAGMSICTPPRKLKAGAELLATFNVIAYPVHIMGMQLVRRSGKILLWGPTEQVRFIASAKPLVIEEAMRTARESLEDMGAETSASLTPQRFDMMR